MLWKNTQVPLLNPSSQEDHLEEMASKDGMPWKEDQGKEGEPPRNGMPGKEGIGPEGRITQLGSYPEELSSKLPRGNPRRISQPGPVINNSNGKNFGLRTWLTIIPLRRVDDAWIW